MTKTIVTGNNLRVFHYVPKAFKKTERINNMARPKKEKELLHNHQIMLRLTDTEYEIVAAKAKDANLPLAEYVRKQVLNKKLLQNMKLLQTCQNLKN